MGGVVDAVTKPFKEVGQEIKKGVDSVAGVGQDIIDVTIKPARDLTLGAVEQVKGVQSATTNVVKGLGEGVGKLAQDPNALAAAAGVALGNPLAATAFLNRKGQSPSTGNTVGVGGSGRQPASVPQINVASTPPIQAVQGNSFMLPIIIGGGALAFILLRRK
tara:strand:+ start:6432 stop:6917 length:486 start_codon:yes stop_codon:yes gene_type:complete